MGNRFDGQLELDLSVVLVGAFDNQTGDSRLDETIRSSVSEPWMLGWRSETLRRLRFPLICGHPSRSPEGGLLAYDSDEAG